MDASRRTTVTADNARRSTPDQHPIPWLIEPDSMVDHFRVMRPIGRGGMAEVHLARDTKLGRRVALKLLRTDLLDNVASAELLIREARTTATFSHPNIVTIHTLGTHGEVPYLALEYIAGQSLHQRLRQAPPTVKESLRYLIAVTEAVIEAHSHGVLHLDLKPENVLIGQDGRVRVVDFGIAQLIASEDGLHHTLHPGDEHQQPVRAGTPAYMAPEQWLELPCDEKTDVWALGVMLFELASRKLPYPHTSLAALLRAVTNLDEPTPTLKPSSDVSTELVRLVSRCMAKDPTERPSARRVHDTLKALLHSDKRSWNDAMNPFRGLLPFTDRQATLFFGREREIDAFCERLRLTPLLPVVGASGAGKSSFVQAGVIPRMQEQGSWLTLTMRPGRRPFDRLCSQLAAAGCRPRRDATGASPAPLDSARAETERQLSQELTERPELLALHLADLADEHGCSVLLFVDQLEELFTHVPEEPLRQQFIRALFCAAEDAESPVRIILTLRDDFMGRLSAWLDGVMVLRTLDTQALEQVLSSTVAATGYRFEDDALLQQMVQAVEGEAGALPLLQFACRQLWELRNNADKTLTREGYRAIGGVAGALAKHLDDVLAGMSPEQEQLARAIFVRLVTPQATRQVMTKSSLLEGLGDGAEAVVERLTKERAVLVQKGQSGPELELVHESIIQGWDRLARWLEESREERQFLAEATQAARLWDKRGRLEEEVWHGDALRDAEQKAARCQRLPEEVRRFLDAGLARKRRLRRRRRSLLVGGFIALSTVAVVVSLLAVRADRQATRAEQKARQARVSETKARANANEATRQAAGARNASRLAAATLYRSDATLMLALIREMEPEGPLPPQWRQLSRQALHQDVAEMVLSHDDVVNTGAFSPDGKRIVTACWDNTVRIWDAGGREAPVVLRGHTDQVTSAAFSPDGQRIVSSSKDKTVRVWDASGQQPPIVLHGHDDSVQTAAFSPDGTRIVTASRDKTVRVWDADGQGASLVLHGHTDHVSSAAFSPDGEHIVSASRDKTARVWDAAGEAEPVILSGHRDELWTAVFSPDGRRIATASRDRTARIWDDGGEAEPIVLRGHDGIVFSVSFSPDSERVITGSSDKTARIWRPTATSTGPEPMILRGHRDGVFSASFSPDGKHILTSSWDMTARLWSLNNQRRPRSLKGHGGLVFSAVFSPDGKRIVTASRDKTARVWDTSGHDPPIVFDGHEDQVYSAAFSPDGTRVVSASRDKTARVWSPQQVKAGVGEHLVLRGHREDVFSAAFSPDGQHIVTASWDKSARIWSAAGDEPSIELRGHQALLYSAAFSPNGKLLVTASQDKTARVWRLQEVLAGRQAPIVLRGHATDVFSAAFSPDSSRIITASFDNTARIWQLDRPNRDGSLPFVELRGHGSRLGGSGAGSGQGAFSPDGQHALTISDDKALRIWKSDGSGEPALLHIPDIDAHSAAFSPDGTRIVTTCHNERDPLSNKTQFWAQIWPTFERFSGLDDPALWTATRYCPPPALREQLLGEMAAGVAEARFRRCQERVRAAFTARQTARP